MTQKTLENAILTATYIDDATKLAILSLLRKKTTATADAKKPAILWDKSRYLNLAHKVLQEHDQPALAELVKIESETGRYIMPFPLKRGFWASSRKGEMFDFSRAEALLTAFETQIATIA